MCMQAQLSPCFNLNFLRKLLKFFHKCALRMRNNIKKKKMSLFLHKKKIKAATKTPRFPVTISEKEKQISAQMGLFTTFFSQI